MTLQRALVMCAFAAISAWPQDPVTQAAIRIRGVVTEIGLGGLAAAQVTVYEFAGSEREKRAVASNVTGGEGEFSVDVPRFGDYWVEVRKDAYFASIPIDGPASQASLASQKPRATETGTLVTVDAAHPAAEVRLALMRPGGMTGTVLDEADKPLDHMLVELWMAGAPALSRSTALTDSDGVFHARTLMPGEYIVRISPRDASVLAPLPKFSADDLTVVDEGLQAVYWPSGTDQASATLARVSPDSEASLGVIRMRKTPSYRVRVSMRGCRPEDLPALAVIPGGSAPADPTPLSFLQFGRKVDSCDDLLVRAVKPGSYIFLLTTRDEFATAQVDIGNKNREVTLTLAPKAEVTGVFVTDHDVTMPDLSKVRVNLLPAVGGAPFASAEQPGAKGTFVVKNVLGLSYRISCTGVSDHFYVKEIRADGHAVADGVAQLYPGSKLEIILDDGPAAITGAVTDRGEAFSQPLIFAAKWPSLVPVTERPIGGDGAGTFQIGGLEPGEYRVVAVPSTPLPDGEQIKFEMLGRLWDGAENVTIQRGETKTLTLKLANPLE